MCIPGGRPWPLAVTREVIGWTKVEMCIRDRPYAVCSSSSGTRAKTVSITNFKLVTGTRVSVKFSNKTSTTPILNVSSTGAKEIKLVQTNEMCIRDSLHCMERLYIQHRLDILHMVLVMHLRDWHI